MNTIQNINTNDTNATSATSTTIESQQNAAVSKTCWMTDVAGFLFCLTVVLQILNVMSDVIDWEFANFIIYNVLPLTGALAYFGLKKDMAAITERKAEDQQHTDSDC